MSAPSVHPEEVPPSGVAAQILQQLPVPVVVVDSTGAITYTNRASDALLGTDADGDSGRSVIDQVHSLDGRLNNLADSMPLRRALSGDLDVSDVMEAVDGHGGLHTVEVVAASIVDTSGVVTAAAEVLWDISGHRAAGGESALLTAIVDSTDDAIVSTDRRGLITSWNSGAEHMYGYGAAETIGRSLSMVVTDDDDSLPTMEDVLSGGTSVHSEAKHRRKDGSTVRVSKSLSVLTGLNGHAMGLVHISRDISDRIEVEAALAQVQRELENRNRWLERSNRDLEQFAYIASHDLSEPLRAVAGMVGLLGRRYQGQLDQDADEFIAFAVEGCERMRSMIEDLLKFSRAGRVELELGSVDLGRLAATVVASLQPQIDDAGATVTLGDLPVVRTDGTQLSQVLQNLISNAIKFRRPDISSQVHVAAFRTGAFWQVDVVDNGIGIDDAYRQRIFRMFQRLHGADAYPGTGIGLSISDRIVDRLGGKISVDSNPSGGSTFSFTLPFNVEEIR